MANRVNCGLSRCLDVFCAGLRWAQGEKCYQFIVGPQMLYSGLSGVKVSGCGAGAGAGAGAVVGAGAGQVCAE